MLLSAQEMRQWQDAAMLYEAAGAYEKAAEIHINTKNFAQAAPLMNSITTPKLHLLYAQAKEAEGKAATLLLLLPATISLSLPCRPGCGCRRVRGGVYSVRKGS